MNYDYIIVGAGSSGCVLANRLSEDPSCSVLLLEAGGRPGFLSAIPGAYTMLHRSAMDWGFATEPQVHVDNRRLYVPRGKVLGGCSTTNAMAYVRGNANDYDGWAGLGNAGWGYRDVLPYFMRSEDFENPHQEFHGTNGPLHVSLSKNPSILSNAFLEACVENGIPYNEDYNGQNQWGAGMLQFTIRRNKRQSTAKAFLDPVRHRKNLTIRTSAWVRRVILEGDRARGVELITGRSTGESILCNKEVIVCAGAIKSPQLLMLSGIGESTMLRDADIDVKISLPGVGSNLQDHVWTTANNLSHAITLNHHIKPLNMVRAAACYFFRGTGPLCNSPIETAAFIKTKPEIDKPDIQFHFAPVHNGNDYKSDIYNMMSLPSTNGFGILVILLHPESSGTVGIRSKNPAAPPIIQPRFLTSENDRNTLLKGLRKAMAVADAKSFKPYSDGLYHPQRNASDDELMSHIRKSLETLYHPVGTCKMGNDSMAVVNDQLQVHGVKALRVIDASIMPAIISGNTNAACIMIGEKGADLVKSDA
jgi:choline dehydrogenase